MKKTSAPVRSQDIAILNQALALERRTVAAYIAGMPLLTRSERKAARQFLNEELEHTGELISLIKAAGGKAPPRADSYVLGHPTDGPGVLALLHSLEGLQISGYLDWIPPPVPGTGASRGVLDPHRRLPAPGDGPGDAGPGPGPGAVRHRVGVSATVPGLPTRRELLATGVGGLAAGASVTAGLIAAGGTAAAATSTTSEPPFSETDRLQRLIRLELLLLYCYRYVLGSSLLGPRTRRTLAPFPGHEEAHIDALAARLRARGGTLPPGPASVAEANRDLAHRKIGGRLGQLKGGPDALRMLLTLEQVTIGAYFVALTKLQDAELIRLACEIMGNEAQHDAMIGLSMPKATPGSAVPYGLVQGLQ